MDIQNLLKTKFPELAFEAFCQRLNITDQKEKRNYKKGYDKYIEQIEGVFLGSFHQAHKSYPKNKKGFPIFESSMSNTTFTAGRGIESRKRVWDFYKEKMPFFNRLIKGSKGIASLYILNNKKVDQLFDALCHQVDELVIDKGQWVVKNTSVDLSVPNSNLNVLVDVDGIQKMVQQRYTALTTRKEKVFLATALKIAIDNNGCIPHEIERSDAGRLYARGINLQSGCSREIRDICLGRHFSYDIECCSFAVLTQYARRIDPNISAQHVDQYIADRSAIRKCVAKRVNVSVDDVKMAFTSIGFFAKAQGRIWDFSKKREVQTALYKYLGQQVDQFLADPFVASFIAEYKAIGDCIVTEAKKQKEYVLHGGAKISTKTKKSKLLANIYQSIEGSILDHVIEFWEQHGDQKLLLPVHDCIKTSCRLDAVALSRHVLATTGWDVTFDEELPKPEYFRITVFNNQIQGANLKPKLVAEYQAKNFGVAQRYTLKQLSKIDPVIYRQLPCEAKQIVSNFDQHNLVCSYAFVPNANLLILQTEDLLTIIDEYDRVFCQDSSNFISDSYIRSVKKTGQKINSLVQRITVDSTMLL
ncbi:hypothetical protein [Motiliproteus sediminis]|uniref:hypothetical protein n=1 Tax=Motiliproteus sediminis TaxID=1468178 RepID=UPI001AEF69E9|nr:hypothetical protein [Motiliproteus sediminis]